MRKSTVVLVIWQAALKETRASKFAWASAV